MNATALVKDLCAEIRTLASDLEMANYRNEKLKDEREYLEADIKFLKETVEALKDENKALKEKIEELEF